MWREDPGAKYKVADTLLCLFSSFALLVSQRECIFSILSIVFHLSRVTFVPMTLCFPGALLTSLAPASVRTVGFRTPVPRFWILFWVPRTRAVCGLSCMLGNLRLAKASLLHLLLQTPVPLKNPFVWKPILHACKSSPRQACCLRVLATSAPMTLFWIPSSIRTAFGVKPLLLGRKVLKLLKSRNFFRGKEPTESTPR